MKLLIGYRGQFMLINGIHVDCIISRMMRCRFRAPALAARIFTALVFAAAQPVIGQSFPTKPIRMLVPTSVGGGSDFIARTISQKMSEDWLRPVVVENRSGGGGVVATQIVADAAPDGHTLMTTSNTHTINPSLLGKLPYDTLKDFAGITLIAEIPAVLVTTPSLGLKTVSDLISLAKSKPGQLSFGSPGSGTGGHLNGEQFKLAAGINSVHVPFRGTPAALVGVISGNIQYSIAPVTAVLPLVKAGRLTALAVSTKTRTPLIPELPTIGESGLPGYDFTLWVGLFAPANIQTRLKKIIRDEVVQIVALQDVKERLLTQGAIPHTTSPEQFDAFIRAEVGHFARLIKASGAKFD